MISLSRFFTNLKLFTVANIFSKSVNFLLIPIYSYTLEIEEFGILDLIFTISMLLMPIISFSIYEGVQKFIIDKTESPVNTLSSSLAFTIIALLGLYVLTILFSSMFKQTYLIQATFFLIASITIFELFSKFSISINKEKIYTFASFILSLTVLSLIAIIAYLKVINILYILYSFAIANLIATVVIFVGVKAHKFLYIKKIDPKTLKKLLIFTGPLTLNILMWWIFDVSDRWIILYFINETEVGLYAVANKLIALIILFHSIIFQAWQVLAVENFGSNNQNNIYKSTFLFHAFSIILICTFLIIFGKFILQLTLSIEFSNAWPLIYPLIFSSLFFCMSSFIGVFYIVTNKTSKVFITSLIAAIVNLFLNFILVPRYGAMGAAVSTLISTFILFLIRLFEIKRNMYFELDFLKVIKLILGMILILFLFLTNNMLLSIFIFTFMILYYVYFLKNESPWRLIEKK